MCERFLRAYTGTLVLISHDREFLDAVVDQIWHIDKQLINVYKGNYSQFERQKAQEVTDVRLYKAGLTASSGARPVKDISEYEDTDAKL